MDDGDHPHHPWVMAVFWFPRLQRVGQILTLKIVEQNKIINNPFKIHFLKSALHTYNTIRYDTGPEPRQTCGDHP